MTPGIIKTLVAIRDSEEATVKQVAIDTDQSFRQVQRHIKTLNEQGLIEPTRKLVAQGYFWRITY